MSRSTLATSAEAGLRRIEALKEIALQGRGEEPLRQVLGGFAVLVKFEADELVDRFPAERHHPLPGEQLARGGLNQRQLGGWKTVAVAANRRVSIAPHQGTMLARREANYFLPLNSVCQQNSRS